MEFQLKKKYKKAELEDFARQIMNISDQIGFKVSSRGWCYILEQYRLINKDQFDKVDTLINNCRRYGYLPIDFVAEESSRQFKGVEHADEGNVVKTFGDYLRGAMNSGEYFTPDWWEGEEYYIQLVVEKVDLVTLFQPVCEEYHIPLANSKGWSSMLQRAEYAHRFKLAQDKGLQCVLLYCGDHDPDGLRISEFIQKNLYDLKDIVWDNGEDGFDPEGLIIERFGLNYDFIQKNKLTWIDNLVTQGGELAKLVNGKIVAGKKSKGKFAGEDHQNFKLPYLQNYLKKYGVRKCEANAIVTQPESARQLVREAIERYLGKGAKKRFQGKRDAIKEEFTQFLIDKEVMPVFDQLFLDINNY